MPDTMSKANTPELSPNSIAFGAAALGVALGLAGGVGFRIVRQAATAGRRNWDDILRAEHEAVTALFDAIEATTVAQTAQRSALLRKLQHALTKHALEEENIVYPALRHSSDPGTSAELYDDHAEIKTSLYALDAMDSADPGFLKEVLDLREIFNSHIAEEETDLFPKLKASLDEASNRALTIKLRREGLKLG